MDPGDGRRSRCRPFRAGLAAGTVFRFKAGVELLQLTVTVTDRAGRRVPDLTVADFAVFEEGKPQVVSHFAADHVPLDVAFLTRAAACGTPADSR